MYVILFACVGDLFSLFFLTLFVLLCDVCLSISVTMTNAQLLKLQSRLAELMSENETLHRRISEIETANSATVQSMREDVLRLTRENASLKVA